MTDRKRMLPLIAGAVLLPVFFLPFTPEDPFLLPKQILLSFFACILFVILFCPSRGRLPVPPRALLLSSFIFLGCITVSIPGSTNQHAGMSELMRWVYLVIIFFASALTDWQLQRLRNLIAAIMMVSALVSISALLEYFKIVPFYLYPFDSGRRLYSFFGYPNILAQYLIITIFWGIGLVLSSQTKGRRGLMFVCVILSFAALSVTFSRGALLATVTGGVFFAYVYGKIKTGTGRGKRRVAAVLGLLIAASVIGIIVTDRITDGKTSAQIIDMFQRADSYRFMLWEKSLSLFSLHPVTGAGLGNVQLGRYLYAHNEVLQMMVETGITGLSGFLIYLFIVGREIRNSFSNTRNAEQKILQLGIVSGIVATLIQSLFSFNLHSATSSFYFFLGAGILCSESELKREKKFSPGTSVGRNIIALCIAVSLSLWAMRGEYMRFMGHYFFSQALQYGKESRDFLGLESSLKAVQYQPHLAKNHRLAGNMYWKTGERKLANYHFQRARELATYY